MSDVHRLDHADLERTGRLLDDLGARRVPAEAGSDPVVAALAAWVRSVDAVGGSAGRGPAGRPPATVSVLPVGRRAPRRAVRRAVVGSLLTAVAFTGSSVAAALTGADVPVLTAVGTVLVDAVPVGQDRARQEELGAAPAAVQGPTGAPAGPWGPQPGTAAATPPTRTSTTTGPGPDAADAAVAIEEALLHGEESDPVGPAVVGADVPVPVTGVADRETARWVVPGADRRDQVTSVVTGSLTPSGLVDADGPGRSADAPGRGDVVLRELPVTAAGEPARSQPHPGLGLGLLVADEPAPQADAPAKGTPAHAGVPGVGSKEGAGTAAADPAGGQAGKGHQEPDGQGAGTEGDVPGTTVPSTGPGSPAEPTTPAEPGTPADPATPAEPGSPADPATPAEPGSPADPATPAEPGSPAQPVTPAGPGAPAQPVTPAGPMTPDGPVPPAHPTTPVGPASAADPHTLP